MTLPNLLTKDGKICRRAVTRHAWSVAKNYLCSNLAYADARFKLDLGIAWAIARRQRAEFGKSAREIEILRLRSEIRFADCIDNWAERNRVVARCTARIAQLGG